MTDPQTHALINRLERAHRRWKRVALGALAALFFVLLAEGTVAVFQWQQISTEQERAEQAIQEADNQREQLKRMFYYNQIALAEREWSQRRNHQP
jgi:hypothetical protein